MNSPGSYCPEGIERGDQIADVGVMPVCSRRVPCLELQRDLSWKGNLPEKSGEVRPEGDKRKYNKSEDPEVFFVFRSDHVFPR